MGDRNFPLGKQPVLCLLFNVQKQKLTQTYFKVFQEVYRPLFLGHGYYGDTVLRINWYPLISKCYVNDEYCPPFEVMQTWHFLRMTVVAGHSTFELMLVPVVLQI